MLHRLIIKLNRQWEFFAEQGWRNFSVSKREFPVALLSSFSFNPFCLSYHLSLCLIMLFADSQSYIDKTGTTENSYHYCEDDSVHLYSDSYDAPSVSGDC